VVALYYIVISPAGLLLSPTTVGLLTDHVFGAEGLRYSVALLPVLFSIPVLLMVPASRRHYLAELQRLEATG